MKKNILYLILLLIASCSITAQNKAEITLSPNNANWVYKINEPVVFDVSISGIGDKEYLINYEVGPEKMPPTKLGSFKSLKSNFSIEGGTMSNPGFLRCTVTITIDNKAYKQIATAAFEPEKIKPTIKEPKDFKKFWRNTIAEARKVPLDTKFTLIKEKCTDYHDVYQVEYFGIEYKKRSYGRLIVPKKEGSYPAIIRFPGAGVHLYNFPDINIESLNSATNNSAKNVILLDLYIHPFPINWEKGIYDKLRKSNYNDYKFWGVNDRDTYYYKGVIASCVKAVDLIYSLPQFNGDDLAAWGASQGGALSIITTALDDRIKSLVVLCPAMCDYTGYLYGRAGGYPHFFNEDNIAIYNNKRTLKTLPYYDVVNFSKMINVPGFYTWGFNDEATPPTSFYAAYNSIKAHKEIFVIPEGRHSIHPEQIFKTYKWLLDSFN